MLCYKIKFLLSHFDYIWQLLSEIEPFQCALWGNGFWSSVVLSKHINNNILVIKIVALSGSKTTCRFKSFIICFYTAYKMQYLFEQ